MAAPKTQTGESQQIPDMAAGVIRVVPPGEQVPAGLSRQKETPLQEGGHLTRVVTEHFHDGVDSDRMDWKDLVGFIDVVTAIPTHKPKLLADSIKLFGSSLYVYNFKTAAWTVVGASVYGGYYSGSPNLPTGWSGTNPTTGNYQITHNLGHTNYGVVFTAHSLVVANITSKGSTTFNVNFKNLASADTNVNFDFVLALTV